MSYQRSYAVFVVAENTRPDMSGVRLGKVVDAMDEIEALLDYIQRTPITLNEAVDSRFGIRRLDGKDKGTKFFRLAIDQEEGT
jgi:hypothetical protein